MSDVGVLHRFHDAELVAIEHVGDNESVQLKFRLANGEAVKLNCSYVTSFRASDFSKQNVVSRLVAEQIGSLSIKNVQSWYGWVQSFSDMTAAFGESEIESFVRSNRDRFFVVVVPSRGAEVVIICSSFSLD